MNKRLSKYIACFDYFDKSLIILSTTSGSVSIASLASHIGALVWIASASFSLAFSMATEIVKQLLKVTQSKIKTVNNNLRN